MSTKWQSVSSDKEAQIQTGYGPLVDTFLKNRGLETTDEAERFLQFKLKDLKDPLSLKDMQKAVERLVQAYKSEEAICVYGDFDMDGTPALALVVRGLRGLGFKKVVYTQPDRHVDGYGFHSHLVEKFIEEHDAKLFITVDVGITDHEAVKRASELGADVLLTDHHQVKDEVPQAYAIVNPNQPDCTAGLGHLCGTGVGFYLLLALRRAMKDQELLTTSFDVKSLLDCFAIGTVADMVPMIEENRVLVKHGLKVLEKTSMIGIRLLIKALKMDNKTLSAQDVGIRLAPKLNSLTRLQAEIYPRDLFLVEDKDQAAEMVSFVLAHNKKRVTLLSEAEEISLAMAKEFETAPSLFLWSKDFHKGLVGLLATRLMQKYNVPAFVGAENDNGIIVGSARAPDGAEHLGVFAALQANEGVLNKFGGHPAAAGFELSVDRAEELREKLSTYFTNQGERLEPVSSYDEMVNYRDIKGFMNWFDHLEPFGFDYSPPVFMMDKLCVRSVKELKGGHLKITFVSVRDTFEALWFFPNNSEIQDALADDTKEFSILCEPQWNEFMGSRRVQLLVKDIRLSN